MRRVPGILRFARMAGSSIAGPDAAAWVTDFLNAAYYARPEEDRHVHDLRLAHGIITTRWASRAGRRLGARDVLALNRAYGMLRLRRGGRLDHAALLNGSRVLIGDWFPGAWADDERRAHGIAFASAAERWAFVPEQRLRRAALGPLTPPLTPPSEQHWAISDPVALPDPDAALQLLLAPARWPDIGAAGGRFTALRGSGLLGQTFEIEVVAEPQPRLPVFARGYVTCTSSHVRGAMRNGPDAGIGLQEAVSDVCGRYRVAVGSDSEPALPTGAEPLALVALTTHEGHFLGRARSHLLVWRDANGAWIRDIGAWDRLPVHLAATYATAGRAAQRQFWGPTPAARSMLAQLALISAPHAPTRQPTPQRPRQQPENDEIANET
jgi:hypothetical protein